jgi:hypothetical protein
MLRPILKPTHTSSFSSHPDASSPCSPSPPPNSYSKSAASTHFSFFRADHGSTSSYSTAPSSPYADPLPYPFPSHQVHFPPPTSLTTTHSTHSPQTYDRTPIRVTQNSCAMPERGCPGRTYQPANKSALGGNHVHPNAVGMGGYGYASTSDESSSAEDSDCGFVTSSQPNSLRFASSHAPQPPRFSPSSNRNPRQASFSSSDPYGCLGGF